MAENPSYYSILPADVRYDNRLKANEKIIYSEITALSNKFGYCTAGNAYFAELYGVIKTTISKWISHLEELGYVKVKLMYDEDGKTIWQRRIYLSDNFLYEKDTEKEDGPIAQKDNRVLPEKTKGYCSKEQGGIAQKDKENITSINITSINSLLRSTLKTEEEEDLIINKIKERWNELPECIPSIYAINHNTKRARDLGRRLDEYGLENVLKAIDRVKDSDFLQGKSKDSEFVIDFDWFLKADNFSKVLEGNYKDKAKKDRTKGFTYREPLASGYSDKARQERFKRMLESKGGVDALYC